MPIGQQKTADGEFLAEDLDVAGPHILECLEAMIASPQDRASYIVYLDRLERNLQETIQGLLHVEKRADIPDSAYIVDTALEGNRALLLATQTLRQYAFRGTNSTLATVRELVNNGSDLVQKIKKHTRERYYEELYAEDEEP